MHRSEEGNTAKGKVEEGIYGGCEGSAPVNCKDSKMIKEIQENERCGHCTMEKRPKNGKNFEIFVILKMGTQPEN